MESDSTKQTSAKSVDMSDDPKIEGMIEDDNCQSMAEKAVKSAGVSGDDD